MDLKGLKYLVVGAGFYGAVMAERIASQLKERVLIIDIRKHIGGNSFSEADPETGIEVHKYGSHIFHTSNEAVWNYINQFTSFNNYQHQVLTKYQGKIFQMPISLFTINDFYGKSFTPEEARKFLDAEISKDTIANPQNLEEKAISLIGRPLYEAFIKGYTQKQWETPLTDLPPNIITRLPVRYSYNSRYFSDRFEGIPVDGYTKIFENLLANPLIEVKLGIDYFSIKEQIPKDTHVIYTGPIDRFFNYKFGELGWRTTDFEVERIQTKDFQGASVMNYADLDVPFTRIHEFKHYHPDRDYGDKTILYKEFSRKAGRNDLPYYPINTDNDKKMLKLYQQEAELEKNVTFGGRLGNYVYIDMHQAIAMALNGFEKMKKGSASVEKSI